MSVFTNIKKDNVTFGSVLCSGFFVLVSFVIVGIFYTHLPPFLPIYNKMPWGYQRLGTKLEVFIPLGVGLLFFILNILFTSRVYKIAPLLARLLSTTATLITFLQCLFIIQLIRFIL